MYSCFNAVLFISMQKKDAEKDAGKLGKGGGNTERGQNKMGKLDQREMNRLRENSYVMRITPEKIFYSEEFKHHFVAEYNAGKKPTQIFREAGFDPRVLGAKRIERASARWRKSFAGSMQN